MQVLGIQPQFSLICMHSAVIQPNFLSSAKIQLIRISAENNINLSVTLTRKLSYRKYDCAMHPMYGCPENFQESLSTPMATFPEIFNGFLFRFSLWKCIQNLKFVALPIR